MTELTQSQLDEFRELLEHRKQELLDVKETGDDSAETVELDQARVGRLSRMDAMQAQAMSKETNRRRDIELQKINAAFQRIDNGEYGFCLNCGEDIAEGRLRIDPATPVCIVCADK